MLLREFFKPRATFVIDQSANIPIHGLIMQINAEFMRILANSDRGVPELINAGAKPLDGTGEPMTQALAKIRDNLKRIEMIRRCEIS